MSGYAGLWIAIVQDEVVAADKSAKIAYKKAKDRYPAKSPLLAKVPTEETMIYKAGPCCDGLPAFPG